MTRRQERTIMLAVWLLTLLLGAFFFTVRAEGSEGSRSDELLGNEERITILENKVEILLIALQANLIGDCSHENVLRGMNGAPPIDVPGCMAERVQWYADYYDIDIDVDNEVSPRL